MHIRDCDPLLKHLPRESREFLLEGADILLRFRDRLFLAHSQVLGLESPYIASLISLRREQPTQGENSVWRGGLVPVVPVLPSSPPASPASLKSTTEVEFGALLEHIYQPLTVFQFETIHGVLDLADYFGCSGVLARADAWLTGHCRQGDCADAAACCAFEVAARHRLGGVMALLLPWAVQSMTRGSRCCTVWYDGKQRCAALEAAFQDSQLKCLVLDTFWWSRQAHQACTVCGCRPADISASWDTRQEWAAAPATWASAAAAAAAVGGYDLPPGSIMSRCAALHPGMYARAVRHYAHMLQEAKWGCTTATTPAAGAARLLPAAPVAGIGGGSGA